MTNAEKPYAAGELEREIILSRVVDAPRERVFKAWVEPEQMFRWFGPRGFHCVVHEQTAVAPGAVLRFDMIAPDGRLYDNRMVFLEVVPNERLVFEHGSDKDDDPHRFRVTILFDAQSDGKTVVTLRQLHPTRAQREGAIGFGAVELGYQTLDKLGAHVRGN
jgi:uncharacterized protein YndB with AHSA1/START domain